jgi:glycogen phosphorylase
VECSAHLISPPVYDRDTDGLPRSWLTRIRASIRTLAPGFCAGRMLDDYLERIYIPTTLSAWSRPTPHTA